MADLIAESQRLYREFLDASRDQRVQIEEDAKFSDPSNPEQWDEDIKRQRENDPGGRRPCLVMDQTSQYVENVAGQVEQRPPAMHALPVDSGADRRVAEQLDGFFRHVEHASRAQQHYTRALRSAARLGAGYLIIRPEYTDRALNWQEPRISSEPDPLRVVLDPWSIELDGSDASDGYLLTPMSHREFKRRYGEKAECVSFGEEERSAKSDDRESVMVAERWWVEEKTQNIIVFTGMDGDEVSLPEDQFHEAMKRGEVAQYLRNYSDKARVVKWCRMSGAAELSKTTEYPADHIGIIPVYGYVGFSDGRMKYCGIPRRARAPQQAYNYHISEIRAYMQLAPKAPWVASQRAIAGLEKLWDRASVESRAVLPYNDLDAEGPIAQPQRPQISLNLANHTQGAEQALRDIQASIGMYQANLGAPSNETSGVAIENRKAQGEASTAHFPSHLAASVGQVGRVVMAMIPRLVDQRRQMRILGIDMTPGSVVVDPQQAEAVTEQDNGGLTINPNRGRYDVRVVVGAAYTTQRQQAQDAYTEMMRANPQMMPALAPLWAQTLDVPHADKLAQVLTAMAPEPVKAILQPGQQGESVGALKAENEQLKAALQEAIQHAQEAQREADEAQAKLDEQDIEAEAKVADLHIKAADAVTRRLQVVGAGLKPEQIIELATQTAQQAAQGVVASSIPEPPDPQEEEMQVQALMQQLSALLEQQAQGTNQAVQQLGMGQAQLTEAMSRLAQLVQAERERVPERDPKTGDIVRVIDRIKSQEAA